MSYYVRAGSRLKLNETDTISSVLQNVSLIVSTVKGDCPLYRDFGIDSSMIDKPIPAAKVLMMSTIKEAVEKYEPRVIVKSVAFEDDAEMRGILVPIVEVDIIEQKS